MNTPKKWLIVLLTLVLIGAAFAEKIISFYIDLLWFDQYGLIDVIWTILKAQFGFAFLLGGIFFALTFGLLWYIYKQSAHLPVVLSDNMRREMPLLQLMGGNLKLLVFFIPLLLSILIGLVAATRWDIILKYLNQVPFEQADPIFHHDYAFYLFTLPILDMFKTMFWAALILVGIGIGIIYFFKQYIHLSPRGFVTTAPARKAICLLVSAGFFLFAVDLFLRRYGLLVDGRSSIVAGISFADDYGLLPTLNLSIAMCVAGGLFSLFSIYQDTLRKLMFVTAGVAIVYAVGGFYPTLLKKFVVDPNELIKEAPYIEHTIAGTVLAFGLGSIEENVLAGANTLNKASINNNQLTLENIRLWDQEPLLDTLGQIQEIRTYYQFNSVDNDRYTINGKYQQTLVSPRELLSSNLPNRTWINEHLTFTHGYGVSLSPVNQITSEGLPVLFIKDIPPRSSIDLQVTQPEIYYGELANDHVFVNTGTMEFDYPEGEKNVYKNYEGSGGILVESFLRKILLAVRFKTMKIIFSEDINSDSRILMYRNITERVQKVAPFLRLDHDPYIVITETGRLVWVYDAYTTSDKFPYSQLIQDSDMGLINYIRNSIKVTIDAYDGTMKFFVTDPKDPIIATYRKMFPSMFSDFADMSQDMMNHIRYPLDLFEIQTFIYSIYHMNRPQVFYNKEDQWDIPEIDGDRMRPYYTIMKLPGKEKEEYILMLPFTPAGKQNLSAWMVARSDGEQYGKLVVYAFPKQKLIYGPAQMVARINQDAEISRQISLWDQRGSKVIQGNLLVIPIEESLIYVRPLYLKADVGAIPELKRVIVGYEDRIVMEPTLEQALEKVFSGLETSSVRTPAQAGTPDHTAVGQDEKIVLSRSDYLKIREIFERTVQAQDQLDNAFDSYKRDLQALGKALDSAVVQTHPAPPVTTEKKSPGPAGRE